MSTPPLGSGTSPPTRSKADRPAAVLVAVQLPGVDAAGLEASLVELQRLAETLGLRVVGRVTQRRERLSPTAVLGEGKLKELARWTGGSGVVEAVIPGRRPRKAGPSAVPREDAERDGDAEEDGFGPDGGTEATAEPSSPEGDEPDDPGVGPARDRATVVLVDHDLGPSQARNLERATGAEVLDRTSVILSIFARHARTREARLQVELAQLAYQAPRLREQQANQDRVRGGVGGKGKGKTALELDRRKIRDRMAELRHEIEGLRRDASTRRERRAEVNLVALVGYTNAGKSSLMRALTGSGVLVADQLFATLDTTVRVLQPPTVPRILVSDTVGFIDKLPHDLVASFRSTLEEARDASLLLHVVDAADPALRAQLKVTLDVLAEIGAAEVPRWLVLNKADRLDAGARAALAAEFPEALLLSAHDPAQVTALHARLTEHFRRDLAAGELLVPWAAQRWLGTIREQCAVVAQHHDEQGTRLSVRAPADVLERLRRELATASA